MYNKTRILITYNIRFKQEQSKIKRILDYYNFIEINPYTYMAMIEKDEIQNLRDHIEKIKKEDDKILIMPICKSCYEKIDNIGKIDLDEESYKIL